MVRDPGALTVLTSKSLSRAGVVQISATSTSKSALAPSQFLTILTSKSLSRAGVVQILATSTSKSALAPSIFNDFEFQIVLARRRGDFNFQKCSRTSVFNDFDFQIVLARRRGANFGDFNFQKCSDHASF